MIKLMTIDEFSALNYSGINFRESLKHPTVLVNFERERPEVDYQNIDWPSGHTEALFGHITFYRR